MISSKRHRSMIGSVYVILESIGEDILVQNEVVGILGTGVCSVVKSHGWGMLITFLRYSLATRPRIVGGKI